MSLDEAVLQPFLGEPPERQSLLWFQLKEEYEGLMRMYVNLVESLRKAQTVIASMPMEGVDIEVDEVSALLKTKTREEIQQLKQVLTINSQSPQ